MYKRGSYILARIVSLFFLLILGVLFAIQTPHVQTRISEIALEKVKELLSGSIQCEEISIMPSGAVLLENVIILDSDPYFGEKTYVRGDSVSFAAAVKPCFYRVDTLARIGRITASFSPLSLFNKGTGIHLKKVTIDDMLFNLVIEPGVGRKQITNIERIFNIPQPDGIRKDPGPEIINIRSISIENMRYTMQNYITRSIWPGFGIDFTDMDLVANIEARNFFMKDSKIGGICDRLYIKEKSGYEILDLSTRVSAGYGKAELLDMHFIDNWSNLYIKEYSMTNLQPSDYSDFINKIILEAHFDEKRTSIFNFHTLNYFCKNFAEELFIAEIYKCDFKGVVSDFNVKNFQFKELYTGATATAECHFTGIPTLDKMALSAKVKDLSLTKEFAGISPKTGIKIDAEAIGLLNDLEAKLTISSYEGGAFIDTKIGNILYPNRAKEINAIVETEELNLGAFIASNEIGRVNLFSKAFVSLPSGGGIGDFSLDSLNISKFVFKDVEYNDIKLKSSFSDNTLKANIISKDQKLKFDLFASVNKLKSLNAITKQDSLGIKIDSKFENIDFVSMKLDTNENVDRASFKLLCDISMNSGILSGDALVDEIHVTNKDVEKSLTDIVFKAYHDGDYHYSLSSPLLKLSLDGDGSIIDFTNDIISLTANEELPGLKIAKNSNYNPDKTYDLNIVTFDTRDILDYFKPGLYVSDSTKLYLQIEQGGNLISEIQSPRLALGKTYIKDINIQLNNLGESLNLDAYGSELRVGAVEISEPIISAFIDNNSFNLSLRADEYLGEGSNTEFFIDGSILRDSTNTLITTIHPFNSHFDFNEQQTWELNESYITIQKGDINVKDFRLNCGSQEIFVDGGFSKTKTDTLSARLKDLDISIIDSFLSDAIGLSGLINGYASITSGAGSVLGMNSSIILDDLHLGQLDAGKINLSTVLSEDSKVKVKVNQLITDRNAFSVDGSYNFKRKRIDLLADIADYPLAIAGPFLQSLFSEVDGSMNGKIFASGTLKDLSMRSENLNINNVGIKLVPTGVKYIINGDLNLDNTGLHFSELNISDNNLGSGKLAGDLTFSKFKDMALNTSLNFTNLKLIDLDSHNKSGLPIYGQIYGDGTATVVGPFNALNINTTVSTTNRGEFHFRTSGSLTGKTSNLLTFTDQETELDQYEAMISRMETKKQNDINIIAGVNLHPGLNAHIDMGGEDGNGGASFNGEGAVNVHIRPSRSIMDLNGEYNFTEGNYRFILPGIINKNFTIQRGSNISFGGDLMDTHLDIDAIYSLKTSLSSICYDRESTGERRQVDCGIKISNNLRNPNIDFSINVPDIDPAIQSEVESVLSTSDKIQKQFLALLVMGTFIPDDNSGIVNGSDLLLSNATEMMSSQLNSIFEKLKIPLDIGFGYQGNSAGNNIFDVAISTQLFNNRVIVGGSVGNRRYGNTTTNDVVGNLDIQVKLDSEGKYRLSLFSHAADSFTNYIDNSQRNGIGFSYIYTPKKKKEVEPVVFSLDE